jgi:hypothetical protein
MYDRLLAQIFTLSPAVVVVASPVPWKTSVPVGSGGRVQRPSARIVDRLCRRGLPHHLGRGMTDAIDGGVENLPDGLHPSQPAYGRMAEQWFRTLERSAGR